MKGISMKKKLVFLVTCVIIVILIGYGIISYLKSAQTKDVEAYLQSEGYSTSDMSSIQTEISKAPLFNTKVIFKDESNVIYYYWKVGDKVRQGTPEVLGVDVNDQDSYKYKHKEKD